MIGRGASILAGLLAVSALSAAASARPHGAPGQQQAEAGGVFVTQAPTQAQTGSQASAMPQAGNSAVLFPEQITPQSVAEARARAAQQEQVKPASGETGGVAQLTRGGEGVRVTEQLSAGESDRALAQLSAAERQVLIDAVNGTDICERSPEIEALQALCENRIETRSAEFTRTREKGSAEDNLLGGGFDSERLATLEAAISRLARNSGRADNFADQAIASVALSQQTILTDLDATETEGDPEKDLSPETEALVNAIAQQFTGN